MMIRGVKISKIILWSLLGLLALLALYPVFFLIMGSLMGNDELAEYLGAVIVQKEGFVSIFQYI